MNSRGGTLLSVTHNEDTKPMNTAVVKRVGTFLSVTHTEGTKPMNRAVVKRVVILLSVTHNEGTKPMNTAVVKKGGGYSYFLFTAMLGRLCRRRITN